jgi:hypothetical protein
MVPPKIKNCIAISVYKAFAYGKNIPAKITGDINIIVLV